MLSEDILVGAVAGVGTAFLFWWAAREPRRERNVEIESILQGEEHKTKGRFG